MTAMAEIPSILALVGPTAVGKTGLSIELARLLNAEIVSCDSMQVYRRLPILSQAPTQAERAAVPHHLIDCVDPTENFSAGQYRDLAGEAINEILGRGKRALVVGGTGLYLRALSQGMCEAPPADPDVRRRLWNECETLGPEPLYERLNSIDRVAAAKIHPRDAKRIIRAIEVFVISGRSLSSWWQTEGSDKPMAIPVIGLNRERGELVKRIAVRQLDMLFEQNVVGEAREVLKLPLSQTAGQVHGLADIAAYLERRVTLQAMIEAWRTRVRQYAKRQLTWFRHVPGIRWLNIEKDMPDTEAAKKVLDLAIQTQPALNDTSRVAG